MKEKKILSIDINKRIKMILELLDKNRSSLAADYVALTYSLKLTLNCMEKEHFVGNKKLEMKMRIAFAFLENEARKIAEIIEKNNEDIQEEEKEKNNGQNNLKTDPRDDKDLEKGIKYLTKFANKIFYNY
jgi:hypothetical protein